MADTQPTLPLPGFGEEPAAPRRRRRAWPWIVVLVVVAALVAAALVAAEYIARGVVETGVRTLVTSQVDLAPGQEVDVEVEGMVLPQLISGTLDEVTVSAPDATFGSDAGSLTGDVTVTARGVPIRGDAAATGGTATVRLDEAQLRELLGNIEDFPADTAGIAGPDVTMSTELSFFGASFPLGIALTPGAEAGNLTLTPAALRLGDAEITADDLRSRFGGLVDPVVRSWSICLAGDLPAALTLTSVVAEGEGPTGEVVATFDIDGAVVVDRALLQPGTCG